MLDSTFLYLKGHWEGREPEGSRVTLLSGPTGSEIYQEVLVKALAKHFDAKLLIFDSNAIPEELSGMDAQTLQDCLLVKSRSESFEPGDRVIYIKSSQNTSGPSFGDRGKVFLEEGLSKFGVRFDNPIHGGVDINGLCEGDRGFFCSASDLVSESYVCEEKEKLNLDRYMKALFEVGRSEGADGPLIIFMKNCEKPIINNVCFRNCFEGQMRTLGWLDVTCPPTKDHRRKPKVVLICSYTRDINENEKDIFEGLLLEGLSLQYLNKVTVEMPKDAFLLANWKNQIERDVEILKTKANLLHIRKALSRNNLQCDGIDAICLRDQVLTDESADKAVTWAKRYHLVNNPETIIRDGNYVISIESIDYGLSKIQETRKTSQGLRNNSQSSKKSLEYVVTENEYEEYLLFNVIPPTEIGVTFEDIGACDHVKETLDELVMFPLRRPELFKGKLAKPCKGVLLFGPPGTGKTMIAKAVATECSLNFLNISMSSITSKLDGEEEKYIKAIFTLASKIAPSMIFIDEIDRMTGECETMRGIKNEFMLNWDRLCGKDKEMVLVFVATNRPFDLDDAVIRRLPRRIMVRLPDAPNRAKILKKILEKEEVAPGIDFDAIANMTEGYTGCDLKDLCVEAAHIPIREFLEKEKEQSSASTETKQLPSSESAGFRPLTMNDLVHAHGQVSATVSSNGAYMTELLSWNEEHGEGGSRKPKIPTYI